MKVAFKPPAAVYRITPHGIRKDAKSVSTPVSAFTVAAPPNSSMEVTITLASRAKKRNVKCAGLPHLYNQNPLPKLRLWGLKNFLKFGLPPPCKDHLANGVGRPGTALDLDGQNAEK